MLVAATIGLAIYLSATEEHDKGGAEHAALRPGSEPWHRPTTGIAVHYTALERGTPVFSSDDEQVGKVVEVLDNSREHIFDGLVIETELGRAPVRRRAGGGADR